MRPLPSTIPLLQLQLGDIVTLPDHTSFSVRSLVKFVRPVESLSGFLLLGEMDMVLAAPSAAGAPVSIYIPVDRFPHAQEQTVSVADGVTRYWAPHLPAVGQAMGELRYRLVTALAAASPTILLYRGPDTTVFVNAGQFRPEQLETSLMPRDSSNENIDVTRHSGDVDVTPSYVPANEEELYATFANA